MTKDELAMEIRARAMECPSLLGITIEPKVIEGRVKYVKTKSGKYFGSFSEAVEYEAIELANEHINKINKDIELFQIAYNEKKESFNQQKENEKYESKINELFSQILNSAKDNKEANTVLDFLSLSAKNGNAPSEWTNSNIVDSLREKIENHFK